MRIQPQAKNKSYTLLKNYRGDKVYTPIHSAGKFRWPGQISFKRARDAESWGNQIAKRISRNQLAGAGARDYIDRLERRLLSLKEANDAVRSEKKIL